MRGRGALAALAFALAGGGVAGTARGDGELLVDQVALRFYAPETGGAARPRFVSQRVLAFEARLEARAEDPTLDGFQERHVRTATERHVTEELLASLPLERPPDEAETARVAIELRGALVQRVGGPDALAAIARREGIEEGEITVMMARRARAALYVEREISPILYPTEEQLREVFRTAPHPFRGQKFDDARLQLSRWFVDERLRGAEAAFLQSARTRVKIVPTHA